MAACECGNDKFVCRFKYHGDAVVDGNNNWEKDIQVDDSEFYGPYTCTKCGKEYGELPKIEDQIKKIQSTNLPK